MKIVNLSTIDPDTGASLTLRTAVTDVPILGPMIAIRPCLEEEHPTFNISMNDFPMEMAVAILHAAAEFLDEANREGAYDDDPDGE